MSAIDAQVFVDGVYAKAVEAHVLSNTPPKTKMRPSEPTVAARSRRNAGMLAIGAQEFVAGVYASTLPRSWPAPPGAMPPIAKTRPSFPVTATNIHRAVLIGASVDHSLVLGVYACRLAETAAEMSRPPSARMR